MNRDQILDLIDSKIDFTDMKKAGLALQKNYEIKTHKMEAEDVKIALNEGHPVITAGKIIIGYNPLKKAFETGDEDFIQIERPVESIEVIEALPEKEYFAITGRNDWGDISEFNNIIGSLRLGEIYLPKHSAIFNFLNPTEKTKKEKIQSVLNGVQIIVYERENYVDNCLHEIGHLFWRTCTRFEEKMQFKELFKHLRTSCIYEYEWERSSEEEVFCTIYKWYMKSVLINKSFFNILEYEESYGLKLLQQVFDRIAKERIIDDIWEMSKEDVIEYLNPPLDKTTGKYIRKSGMLDKIKDIELPESVLNRIESVQNGQAFIGLGKACFPVNQGLIDFEKAKDLSKLTRKQITDKRGHIKTVWVKTGQEEKKESKGSQIDTPEFKKWFGDSKVVDKQGKPLVVYHGGENLINNFKEKPSSRGFLGAAYFTLKKNTAEKYAYLGGIDDSIGESSEDYKEEFEWQKEKNNDLGDKLKKRNPVLTSVYLKIEKPLKISSISLDDVYDFLGEDSLIKIFGEEYNEEEYKNVKEYLKNYYGNFEYEDWSNIIGHDLDSLKDEASNGFLFLVNAGYLDSYMEEKKYDGIIYDDAETKDTTIVPLKSNQIKIKSSDSLLNKQQSMQKAINLEKPIIYLDMDGCVTFFALHYKNLFNRDVFKDDSFTVTEMCKTEPRFFLTIPVLQRGKELYDRLIKKYNVVFLTTPMDELPYCRADKVTWLKQNICSEPTIIFSASKGDYAHSEKDILIDDMDHNIQAFYENGGTAINFLKMSNDEIMQKIAETLNPQAEIIQIKQQIKEMKVNTLPTERQKESGIYAKGKIIFKQIPVMIENPKGSIRFGIGENGKKWLSKMHSHYGYIKGTEGNDFDPIDCFIGDDLSSTKVFIINQGFNNLFDEHKILLGFNTIEDARQAFLKCYEKGWEKNVMNIVPTNTKILRQWLKTGNYKEPFSGEFK